MNSQIFSFIARLIVLFTAIPVHESAHALAAYEMGDPTAKNQGRLSLNPFHHFDKMGTISLILIGVGWAKPVPVNPRNFKNPKRGMALSAAAGPVSNLLMAYLSMVIAKLMIPMAMTAIGWYYAYIVVIRMCVTNIALAVFNLLPVPPFDGSRIYGLFLPKKIYFGIMKYEKYVMLAVIVLVFAGVLDSPLSAANSAVLNALDVTTRWVNLLMGTI